MLIDKNTKKYSNEHPKNRKNSETTTIKVASYRPGKLIEVGKMKRRGLVKHLNSMELPETNAKDFDDEHIKELLIRFAPDLFKDSRE